jgi:hypothetical protein
VNTDEARVPKLVIALAGRANGIDTLGTTGDDLSLEFLNDAMALITGGNGTLLVVVDSEKSRG